MNEHIQEQARTIYRTVRMLHQHLTRTHDQRVRSGEPSVMHDLTPAQFNTMIAIRDLEETSVKELAEHMHVSPPSASTMVDRLVEMGMLVREQSRVDRREVRIRHSEKGQARLCVFEQEFFETIGGLLEKVGPEDASRWCSVYDKIYDIIQAEDAASYTVAKKANTND